MFLSFHRKKLVKDLQLRRRRDRETHRIGSTADCPTVNATKPYGSGKDSIPINDSDLPLFCGGKTNPKVTLVAVSCVWT